MDELSKLLQILEAFDCGTGASATGCGGHDDDVLDVEDLNYSDDYKTQWSPYCENDETEEEIEESSKLIEQDEPPVETPKAPTEVVKKKETEVVEPEVPETPEDVPETPEDVPTGDETGAIPGMAMPGEEEEVPKDPETLGRIYELKKIYSRLVSIESFLNDVSEPILLKLRNFVSESIELFQLMINNVDIFVDKIDEIIILYYKFLRIVYELLKQFYERENEEDKKEIKRGK